MTRTQLLALSIAASTCLALPSAVSAEGKTDQARKAIAAAQAKIDAVKTVGAAGDSPGGKKRTWVACGARVQPAGAVRSG